MWELPDGSSTSVVDTIIIGDQLGGQDTVTRTLTINGTRTSQAGMYTCRATIDIQGINPLSQIASQTIRVESKLSVQIRCVAT